MKWWDWMPWSWALQYSCRENSMSRWYYHPSFKRGNQNTEKLNKLLKVTQQIVETEFTPRQSDFPGGLAGKESTCNGFQATWVQSLGWEDPTEKRIVTYSSILACRIPWTVQSMGSQTVGHNWVTFTFRLTLNYIQFCFLLKSHALNHKQFCLLTAQMDNCMTSSLREGIISSISSLESPISCLIRSYQLPRVSWASLLWEADTLRSQDGDLELRSRAKHASLELACCLPSP